MLIRVVLISNSRYLRCRWHINSRWSLIFNSSLTEVPNPYPESGKIPDGQLNIIEFYSTTNR